MERVIRFISPHVLSLPSIYYDEVLSFEGNVLYAIDFLMLELNKFGIEKYDGCEIIMEEDNSFNPIAICWSEKWFTIKPIELNHS